MNHCIYIFILFYCITSDAQQIVLTPDFVKDWKMAHPYQGNYHPDISEYHTGLILASVYDYNTIQKRLGLADTIKVYRKSSLEFEYRINDVLLDNNSRFGIAGLSIPGYQTDIDPFAAVYEFWLGGHGGDMNSNYHTSDSTYYTIICSSKDEFRDDPSIKIDFFTHGFLNGRSEHFTESGKIFYKGHYMLKDTMYRDTVIEPTDWSERIMVYERLYVSKKCGTWTETKIGEEAESIVYPDCVDDSKE